MHLFGKRYLSLDFSLKNVHWIISNNKNNIYETKTLTWKSNSDIHPSPIDIQTVENTTLGFICSVERAKSSANIIISWTDYCIFLAAIENAFKSLEFERKIKIGWANPLNAVQFRWNGIRHNRFVQLFKNRRTITNMRWSNEFLLWSWANRMRENPPNDLLPAHWFIRIKMEIAHFYSRGHSFYSVHFCVCMAHGRLAMRLHFISFQFITM